MKKRYNGKLLIIVGLLLLSLNFTVAFNAGGVCTAKAEENASISQISVSNAFYTDGYAYLQFQLASSSSVSVNSSVTGYWNDHADKADVNKNVDIMEYVYVNGVSTRYLSDVNKSGKTNYSGGAYPQTSGGCYAPVSVEVLSGGIVQIFILEDYCPQFECFVTFKSGFTLKNADGDYLVLSSDKTFIWYNGTLAERTVTDISSLSPEDWHDAEKDGYSYINLPIRANTVYGAWESMAEANVHWNNGADPLDYIAITDCNKGVTLTAREIYLADNSAVKFMTTGDGRTVLKLKQSYVVDGYFTFTLRSGFYLYTSSTAVSMVNEDTVFGFSTLGEVKSWKKFYKLSFTGTEKAIDPVYVPQNSVIGNLPEVPAKNGYSGYWQIGDELLTVGSVYKYSENKKATAVYTPIEKLDSHISDFGTWGEAETGYTWINIAFDFSTLSLIDWTATAKDGVVDNGVNLLDYVYVNDLSVREIYNANNGSVRLDTVTWESAVVLKVSKKYLDERQFTVTLKKGFTVLGKSDGKTYSYELSNDIINGWISGIGFVRLNYTLSFDGLTGKIAVTRGKAIGELPVVPYVYGKTGTWQIGDDTLSADTVYNYTEDHEAKVCYKDIEYFASFIADGSLVAKIRYTVLDKTVAEPSVPYKKGYDGSWEEYVLPDGDITVNAKYTVTSYGATLKRLDGSEKTVTYNVENRESKLQEIVALLPKDTEQCRYFWEGLSKELPLEDGKVYKEIKEDVKYTVTFMLNGEVFSKAYYTAGDKNISVPNIPTKEGYSGKWEDYKLDNRDTVVNAVYSLNSYKVTFVADGVVVSTVTYTVNDFMIDEPPIPTKDGYSAKWARYSLDLCDVTVNAVYKKASEAETSEGCGSRIGGGFTAGILCLSVSLLFTVKRRKNKRTN